MTDVSFAMQAKSDQLNAVDILGADRIIRVRDVRVVKSEQPVSVYFDGDNNRPWKPSKGMIRILGAAWGTDSTAWIGRSALIYCEPSVKYAGQEVGGIRIRALSDIPAAGLRATIAISKQKREPYPVQFLNTERPSYPADKFAAALPKMVSMMQSGEMSLQSIIAQCQKTGDLTAEQLGQLEQAAPIEVTDEEQSEEGEVF